MQNFNCPNCGKLLTVLNVEAAIVDDHRDYTYTLWCDYCYLDINFTEHVPLED